MDEALVMYRDLVGCLGNGNLKKLYKSNTGKYVFK